ncbi:MAG: GNAT family N-acetyltransferase [Actinomycetota bacterium]|nr:GNAT family N-acetyltransferase [Actinomycetota bacterium]
MTERPDPEAAELREREEGAERPFAVTARRDEQVVGVASGVVRDGVAHLRTLVVHGGQRRQGIGSHLLAAVESLAADQGCRSIVTDSALEELGEAFLRTRGWTSLEPNPRFGRDPG